MSEIPTYPNESDDNFITHVAIIFNGRIWSLPRPYRHHHVIRIIIYLDHDIERVDGIQGFLDANGKFLTRKEARVVAEASGQIKNGGKMIGSILTSEDLW